ncbi:MAG TPA: hemolysin family protein [Anaerolineales bacterium]
MDIGIRILIIFLLILMSGFFAMSEAAIFAARKSRLQHRANEGDLRARRALDLSGKPNRFLPTVTIGITLVGILSGAIVVAIADALATQLDKIPALIHYSHSISLTLVVILLTFVTMLLGELVPKRIALYNAEKIASGVAGFMSFVAAVLYPVVWLLGRSTDAMLHLLRIKHTDAPPVTEEELLVQLNEGTQAGVFEEAEQDMVEGVFSLSDQRVNALMTPRNEIIWLDVNDTVAEIRNKVKGCPFSRFPVGDDSLDNVVGVVKAKELLLADLKNGQQIKDIARPPLFVPETALGSRALEILKQEKREMVLVVDEFGVVQGLLTLADILEEIVGAFEGESQATQRQDGSWLLDGMLPNDEFKEIFNLRRLPDEEEYETLGGFIMLQLGRIPQAADLFEWNNLRFEVMDMHGKRVDKILVTTIPAKPPAAEK